MAGLPRNREAFFYTPPGLQESGREALQDRIQASTFRPAWWLRNRHLQTIFPTLPWTGAPRVGLQREHLDLPDGDVTVVDWLRQRQEPSPQDPTLVILHGLEGSADSPYARMLLQAASRKGWHAAVLHFRDCGDYRNRLPRRYHAGETGDFRYFLDRLATEGREGPLFAVGYSLGGNVLLKYLGETGAATPLDAAAAISVPLNLHDSAEALSSGFSKVYQYHLIKRMKQAVRRKFRPDNLIFDWQRTMAARTFAEFDDAVTAPLHGFSGKDEYYDRCSSIHYLAAIERPTLIINAVDDPFMTTAAVPTSDLLGAQVHMEVSPGGGHVGFVSGGTPWKPRYYLPDRIIGFLAAQVSDSTSQNATPVAPQKENHR